MKQFSSIGHIVKYKQHVKRWTMQNVCVCVHPKIFRQTQLFSVYSHLNHPVLLWLQYLGKDFHSWTKHACQRPWCWFYTSLLTCIHDCFSKKTLLPNCELWIIPSNSVPLGKRCPWRHHPKSCKSSGFCSCRSQTPRRSSLKIPRWPMVQLGNLCGELIRNQWIPKSSRKFPSFWWFSGKCLEKRFSVVLWSEILFPITVQGIFWQGAFFLSKYGGFRTQKLQPIPQNSMKQC